MIPRKWKRAGSSRTGSNRAFVAVRLIASPISWAMEMTRILWPLPASVGMICR